jgi:hypothetical protein
MLFIYMSGVLSTIEKQFEIKSEHSAYMMSGNEFSQVLMIFFLPAFAKVRRTPLWIAVGEIILISLLNYCKFEKNSSYHSN